MYGNRDLAAYEEGRRDIEKIVRRFGGCAKSKNKGNGNEEQADVAGTVEEMPKDVAKAYLERLGTELLERAERL